MKINNILELLTNQKKKNENLKIQLENNENHETHTIPFENYDHENLRIPNES